MSKWEDTVMSICQINDAYWTLPKTLYDPADYDRRVSVAEAQAEISFKAGIKEVVETIDNTGLIGHTDSPLHETGATILNCPACCWYTYKAKLKEWGIECEK